MLLDAIIGLIGSLIYGVLAIGALCVNLVVALIEFIIGLFVPDFSMRRFKPRKREKASPSMRRLEWLASGISVLVVIGFLTAPMLLNRTVTLVAVDGHSLPFAALIIHSGEEDRHERTDDSGKIAVPRFGTTAISLKDPRYVAKTWEKSEIGSELVVERTLLGEGLDSFADRFLKPAKD